jgi:hypothetical protein
MNSAWLAREFAQRLVEVLPPGFTICPEHNGIWLDAPDGYGTFGWLGAVDQDPVNGDLYPGAVETAMNSIQECICETIRDVWPRLKDGAPGHQMALPGARREGNVIKLWFGSEHAPVIQLRPIVLDFAER